MGDLTTGDLFAIPLPDGHGAGQVTAVTADRVVVCLLDWHGAHPPTADDVADVDPLRLDHHAHRGGPCCVHVDGPPPHRFVPVGNAPVRAGRPTTATSYAGWAYLARQLVLQRRWDRELPAAVKDAYRSTPNSTPVTVDFGAGPRSIPAGTNPVDLTGAGEVPVPEEGPVSWAALDALNSTSVTWSGDDRGLSAALAARPIIDTVYWQYPPAEVNLSASAITNVFFGPGLRSLLLPAGASVCAFGDGAVPTSVTAHDDGRWIDLSLRGAAPSVPAGLRAVREMRIDAGGAVSVAALAALPALTSLTVQWSRGPGRLDDPAALAGLSTLRELYLVGGYGLGADTLPDLPALRHLVIDGVPRSVAAALKARYGATPVRVTVRGAKSDTWLRANIENPFRDWVDDDERGGTAACRAYATALRGIDQNPADAERRLRTLVEALNRIDGRHGLIDTLRREEAADAFFGLARRAGVPNADAEAWFDDWRDF